MFRACSPKSAAFDWKPGTFDREALGFVTISTIFADVIVATLGNSDEIYQGARDFGLDVAAFLRHSAGTSSKYA